VYRLVVESGGIEVPLVPGDTVDQALDRAGWFRAWGGCRAGGCGACHATILDLHGNGSDGVSFATGAGDLGVRNGARRILACVAVPTSDLRISFRVGQVRPRA